MKVACTLFCESSHTGISDLSSTSCQDPAQAGRQAAGSLGLSVAHVFADRFHLRLLPCCLLKPLPATCSTWDRHLCFVFHAVLLLEKKPQVVHGSQEGLLRCAVAKRGVRRLQLIPGKKRSFPALLCLATSCQATPSQV